MNSDSKRLHVFVSHYHRDDAGVDDLTKLLNGRGYGVRNSSIRAKPKNRERLDNGEVKDETIRRLLRMKISWAGALIVLIGKQTHTRRWVDWEIRQAHKQGKRIVGVFVRGGTEVDVPEALKKYGSELVAWNADSILGAVEGTDAPFQNPDGSPALTPTGIPRSVC